MISRRQPQNLKCLLTKAEFSTRKPKPSVSRCNEPRCGTCDLIITGDSVKLRGGKAWTIKSSMTYKSKDVVEMMQTACEKSMHPEIKRKEERHQIDLLQYEPK